uniref:Helicase C-terminal domain-containing protein n=1 Tax=Mesocestoides corti TaxID=53468 RepID=A0A5K3F5H9_MESCO
MMDLCSASQDSESNEKSIHELVRMSGKLLLLDRLLQKLVASGHKTLVFSQFTMVLDVIEDLLVARNLNWVRLDGS